MNVGRSWGRSSGSIRNSHAQVIGRHSTDQPLQINRSLTVVESQFFLKAIASCKQIIIEQEDCGSYWAQAIIAYCCIGLDRLADRSSTQCRPDPTPTQSGVINTFSRFALPIYWDFIEGTTTESSSGGFLPCLEWVARVVENTRSLADPPAPIVNCLSALNTSIHDADLIVTDPPYYDAIGYSVLMDFFY